MTGGARPAHGVGRAARARGVRCVGVDPEPQGDADGGIAAIHDALQRHRGVDAARHGDGRACARRHGRQRGDRVGERLGERVEGHGGALAALRRDLPIGGAVREAERRGVEQRSALGMLGRTRPPPHSRRHSRAPRSGPRRCGHPRRAAAGCERDRHTPIPGSAVAVGSLEDTRASEICEGEPHARTAELAARSTGTSARRPRRGAGHARPRCTRRTSFAARRARATAPRPSPRARCSARSRRCGRPRLQPPRIPDRRAGRRACRPAGPRAARGCGRGGARRRPTRSADPGAPRAARARTHRGRPPWSRRARCRRRAARARRRRRGLRHALGARAQRALLAAAMEHGRERRDAPSREHTGALRAVQLVAGERGGQRPGQLVESQGQPRGRLHGIEVQRHPALGAQLGDLAHRLDHTRQVARPDDRAQAVARADQRGQRAQVDDALRIDRCDGDLPAAAASVRATAGCSSGVVTTRPPPARRPSTARLSASEPPPVKMTSSSRVPSARPPARARRRGPPAQPAPRRAARRGCRNAREGTAPWPAMPHRRAVSSPRDRNTPAPCL